MFLGDNVYPSGLRPRGRGFRRDTVPLAAQVDLVAGTGARGLFLPGNHDWDGGVEALERQADFVRERGHGAVVFVPEPGCPGPAVRDVGRRLRLVVLDTEWWLRSGGEPRASGCRAESPARVTGGVRRALAEAGSRRVVVLAHHPLRSGGYHGGYVSLRQHLFPFTPLVDWLWLPLPGARALYEGYRELRPSRQSLASAPYRILRDSLAAAFGGRGPLLYAAGHEHGIQVLGPGPAGHEVVSGSASRVEPVGALDDTRFRAARRGFVRVDVTRSGRVRLGVHLLEPDAGPDGAPRLLEAYAVWLTGAARPAAPASESDR